MKVTGSFLDRQTVLDGYLNRENAKEEGKEIPPPYPELAWDNVAWLDLWLQHSGYKEGDPSGFRWWLPVELSFADLLDCAIWSGLFKGEFQRLGDLLDSGRLKNWEPTETRRDWYHRIKNGGSISPEWPLILRPALPSEKAALYVEDGSGRATWLVAQPSAENRTAAGLIAFDPEPSSTWLAANLEGRFLQPEPLYAAMIRRFPELANHAPPD
jgi:hypothetical protein